MAPFVSIITVVYNGKKHLEKTILSIIEQTGQNIEYIIIDGGSKDGTVDIIKKHQNKISKWISEPDKGIYDAMNKGLKLASGEYVWYMNAGDVIYSNDTLQQIAGIHQREHADVYYGETEETDENGKRIGMRRLKAPGTLTWENFSMGMVVCHQSILIKKELCSEYNLSYRISADIDWIINAVKKSSTIVNTHLILSKFQHGGLSRNNITRALKERFGIMTKHYGLVPTFFNHFIIGMKFLIFVLRNGRY